MLTAYVRFAAGTTITAVAMFVPRAVPPAERARFKLARSTTAAPGRDPRADETMTGTAIGTVTSESCVSGRPTDTLPDAIACRAVLSSAGVMDDWPTPPCSRPL